jgi:hypothetical protein
LAQAILAQAGVSVLCFDVTLTLHYLGAKMKKAKEAAEGEKNK